MVVCKIMMDSLPNENPRRGGQSSRIGVDAGASPRTYHTDIGVSPSSAPRRKDDPPETDSGQEQEDTVWFLMRAAYGQERKAKEVLEADNIEVFLPMTNKMHLVNGKRKCITESLIPNFLFVHSTERLMKKYVGCPKLNYFHHYYIPNKDENGIPIGKNGRKPLVIPDDQMEAFFKWYEAEDDNKMFVSDGSVKIVKGDKVKITQGKFIGFCGFVCRVKRQTRVGVTIDGLGTIVTAYIPRAFLTKVTEE